MLRATVSDSGPEKEVSDELLEKNSKIVYEWMTSMSKRSYVRMLHTYQANGGMSYVTNVYNICTSAFLEVGESKHRSEGDQSISLETFTRCIKVRHKNSGGDDEGINDRDELK